MWSTKPELASMLLNTEDGYKYTYSANQKVDWKCLNCNTVIKQKYINNVNRVGLSCPLCSDGVSFPEKFIYYILRKNGVEFKFQKRFPWSQGKLYDFYIPSLNCIIEIHGEHHSTGKYKNKYVRNEKENDIFKKEIAFKNKIEEYIEIDAEKSFGSYIANSIMNLSSPYKFWLMTDFSAIEKQASQSLMKETWNLWNKGLTVGTIAKELGFTRHTIRKYLNRGEFAGQCIYSTEESRKRGGKISSKTWEVSIVQFDYEMNFIKEWDSAQIACKELNLSSSSSIHGCCRGRNKTAAGFRWMYLEEYEKLKATQNVINTDITHQGTSIVQLSQQGEFIKSWKSMISAEKELNISSSGISSVCVSRQQTAGGFKWAYQKDYDEDRMPHFIEKNGHKRKVVQLSNDLRFVKLWNSATEASNAVGVKKASGITLVSQGLQKSSGGFKWAFAEDYYKEGNNIVND
jgi:hypothetical protein